MGYPAWPAQRTCATIILFLLMWQGATPRTPTNLALCCLCMLVCVCVCFFYLNVFRSFYLLLSFFRTSKLPFLLSLLFLPTFLLSWFLSSSVCQCLFVRLFVRPSVRPAVWLSVCTFFRVSVCPNDSFASILHTLSSYLFALRACVNLSIYLANLNLYLHRKSPSRLSSACNVCI